LVQSIEEEARMRSSNGTVGPTVDWREWVAFLGYVLAASVAVSVALASVVLLLATHAEDPQASLGSPASARSPIPPASTVLRQRGVQPPETRLSAPRPERAARAGSTVTSDGTGSLVTTSTAGASRVISAVSEGTPGMGALAAEAAAANTGNGAAPGSLPTANRRPLGKTPVLPASQPTEAATATATGAGAAPGSSAAQDAAVSASATGLPGSGDTTQAFAAILQPIPEPSPSAAAILQPLAPASQPLGPSSADRALGSGA
jgi:hypothetical protein